MSATRAARCSATRWRASSTSPDGRRRANITSTTPGAQVERPRPLGLPALPRGARRADRRHPGGPLSRRLPEGGRRGAQGRIRRGAPRHSRKRIGCRSSAQRAIDAMMAMIRDDLAALNITHEVFASERALTGADGGPDRVEEAIDALRAKGLIYEGRLPPPKGAPADDWEDREQTLFRSTAFGDDVDRPLDQVGRRLHLFRQRHRLSQDQDRPRLSDAGRRLGRRSRRLRPAHAGGGRGALGGKAKLEVRLCQLVRLMRAGEQVKMSKRSGDFVTLREVVDEVGPRRRALHHAHAQERRAARLRPRQGDRAEPGQSGLLRPVRPRPRVAACCARAAAAFPDLDLDAGGARAAPTPRS